MLIIFVPSVALGISLWLEVDLIFQTLLEFCSTKKRNIKSIYLWKWHDHFTRSGRLKILAAIRLA